MTNPYKSADEELRTLKKELVGEFQNLSLSLTRMDEINALNSRKKVQGVYKRINRRARDGYRRIMRRTIKETADEIKGKPIKDLDLFLISVLTAYNPVTEYRFDREIVRKRDRAAEAVLSAKGAQDVRKKLLKHLMQIYRQVAQYADECVDYVRLETMKDNGITNVKWVSEKDDKTCSTCRELDGKIFPINNVPGKQHYHCRCYLVPAVGDEIKAEKP